MPPPLTAAARLGITCRPMADGDLPFAERVYASTRSEELARTAWPPEQIDAFLALQHRAQHAHYRAHYPEAEWLIVERDGEAVGRLYLAEWEEDLRIVDISLLPAARGQGIGGAIVADLIAAAHRAGRKVSIHVEQHNPARRLYARLGFTPVEERGAYILMECPAPAAPA